MFTLDTTEVLMSQRHRSPEVVAPPKMDLRAKAHSERHRIRTELQAVAEQISSGLPPEDVHEPGRAWIPEAHRDVDLGGNGRRKQRHWKMKMWKRRTNQRKARAQAYDMIARQA